jgi:prepilin-type N-terminal cleavage/methylation domain-containing protein
MARCSIRGIRVVAALQRLHIRRGLDDARHGGDDGFSLIEVMVSMLVLGLVGFYENLTGFSATVTDPSGASRTTVDLGATAPSSVDLTPTGSEVVGGVTYAITLEIVWADATVPSATGGTSTDSQAYKQVYAVVTWNAPMSGTHTLTESSLVYPGGLALIVHVAS